jgi:hypothetical protein
MSQSNQTLKEFGSLNVNQITFQNKGAIAQATSISTNVLIDAPVGSIQTVSTSLTTAGSTSFVCYNSSVSSNTLVFANLQKYSGSQGSPKVHLTNVTTGSFTINIQNVHDTQPLNGFLTIGYMCL